MSNPSNLNTEHYTRNISVIEAEFDESLSWQEQELMTALATGDTERARDIASAMGQDIIWF